MTLRDSVDLVVLSAVWGASFLFMRIAAPEFGPVVLVQLRLVIAALFLLPVFMFRCDARALKSRWGTLALLGFVNSALPFVLLSYSTLHITGGYAAILNATAPLFAAVIAYLWLSEKLNRSRVAGLIIGFSGVLMLVWNTLSLSSGDTGIAILAGTAAALSYGLGGNYARQYLSDLDPLAIATGSMIAASVILLPGTIYFWPSEAVSAKAWLSVVIMGIASTGLAYILYFRLIRSIGPARAITVTYLIPVFAAIWGAVFIDEAITKNMVIGCSIIFVGTALSTGLVSLSRR